MAQHDLKLTSQELDALILFHYDKKDGYFDLRSPNFLSPNIDYEYHCERHKELVQLKWESAIKKLEKTWWKDDGLIQ